jgi:hypothetical protein
LANGVLGQISLTAWQSADAQVHDASFERIFKAAAASQATHARADGRPFWAANHKADYTANCGKNAPVIGVVLFLCNGDVHDAIPLTAAGAVTIMVVLRRSLPVHWSPHSGHLPWG